MIIWILFLLIIRTRHQNQVSFFSGTLTLQEFNLALYFVEYHFEQTDLALSYHVKTVDPHSDQFDGERVVFPSILTKVVHKDNMSRLDAAEPPDRHRLVPQSYLVSELAAIAVDLLHVCVLAVLQFVTLPHVFQVVDHNDCRLFLSLSLLF